MKNFFKQFIEADILLIMRGIACLAVIITHYYPPLEWVQQRPLWRWPFAADGSMAVLTFFILSGYLMVKLFDTKKYDFSIAGVKKFYLARIKRIVPLYLFVLFVGVVFVHPELLQFGNLKKLFYMATFTQYIFPKYDFILGEAMWFSIAWTLVIELQYYLFAPLFAYLILHSKKLCRYFFIAFFWGISILSLIQNWGAIGLQTFDFRFGRTFFCYFPFFIIGGLIVPLTRSDWYKSTAQNLISRFSFFSFLFMILLFILPTYYKITEKASPNLTYYLLILTSLVIVFHESKNYLVKPHSWSQSTNSFSIIALLEVFGHLSYGAYLWHRLIIESIVFKITYDPRMNLRGNMFFYIMISSVIIITMTMSYLTFMWIENKKPQPITQNI
jgi:peptidoglycan/LPS O-acetylase OafA/YrhL